MIEMGRANMMSLIKSSRQKNANGEEIVFVMIIIIIFMRR